MRQKLLSNAPVNIAALILPISLLLAACTHVPVYEQELVSKTGMTLTDSMVEGDQVNLISQIETGSSVSGGAVAAGCTACR